MLPTGFISFEDFKVLYGVQNRTSRQYGPTITGRWLATEETQVRVIITEDGKVILL